MNGPAYGILRIEGESYLPLEAVAQCYGCEVAWLREAFTYGLFGAGLQHGGRVLLHVAVLDRVADVLRLGRHQGLAFEAMALLFGDQPAEGFVAAVILHE